MKLFTLFITFIALTISSVAQSDTIKQIRDTSYLKIGRKQVIIIEERHTSFNNDSFGNCNSSKNINISLGWEKRFDAHYAGIEFGINNYLNKDFEMQVPEDGSYMELDDSKSIEFNLNLVDVSIPIIKNQLGLVTGIGFSWNNYKFDNKQLILQNDAESLYVIEDTVINYSKNKLSTFFVNVPIMFEFQQPIGNKNLWIAVGAYGGVKLGSNVKLKTNDNSKNKTRKDYHLNTLRYGLRAQVGFDNFGIYCNYSLASLFKNNEGPELYPISLGVSLAF